MNKKLFLAIAVTALTANVFAKDNDQKEFNLAAWASEGINAAAKRMEEFSSQAQDWIEKAQVQASQAWEQAKQNIETTYESIKQQLATPEINGEYKADENAYVLTMDELPDYDASNIEVEVHSNKTVTVKGSKELIHETKDTAGKVISSSKSKSQFQQAFQLPEDIIVTNMQGIKAEYKNNKLTIKIPARKKEAQPVSQDSIKVTIQTEK